MTVACPSCGTGTGNTTSATGTANSLPKFTGGLAIGTSLFTDTGSAGAYGGPFNATGSLSSGTPPVATACPSAAALCATEGNQHP